MFAYPYLIEMLTPKRAQTPPAELFDRFAGRFSAILDAGCGISVPDNPMGQPRYSTVECIERSGLAFNPEYLLMNLNTFHTREELDTLLAGAAAADIRYILAVRGDGGPLLGRLDPKSIGGSFNVATTPDLLRYINTAYPGRFITGAAFNHYKPAKFELKRTRDKIDAGACFIVTQPIIGRNETINRLLDLGVPVVLEAWMSDNIELLYRSVGRKRQDGEPPYDPWKNLQELQDAYPGCCIYLSMLSFKKDWRRLLSL